MGRWEARRGGVLQLGNFCKEAAREVKLQRDEKSSSQRTWEIGASEERQQTPWSQATVRKVWKHLTKEENRNFNFVFTCRLETETLTKLGPISLEREKMTAAGGDGDSEISTSVWMETERSIHKTAEQYALRVLDNFLSSVSNFAYGSLGKHLDLWTNFISNGLKIETIA